jgi:hypothetical protein
VSALLAEDGERLIGVGVEQGEDRPLDATMAAAHNSYSSAHSAQNGAFSTVGSRCKHQKQLPVTVQANSTAR